MAAQISEGDRYLGKAVDVVCFDLWRVFDTVSHNILMGKIKKHGWDEWTVRWIEDCSTWTCLSRGIGLDDLQRYLCIPTILWFCDVNYIFLANPSLYSQIISHLNIVTLFRITFFPYCFCHEKWFEVVVSWKVKFSADVHKMFSWV